MFQYIEVMYIHYIIGAYPIAIIVKIIITVNGVLNDSVGGWSLYMIIPPQCNLLHHFLQCIIILCSYSYLGYFIIS